MKLRQKIDKAASDQLERILTTFPKSWGTADRGDDLMEYRFDSFSDGAEMAVAYDAKKQLLGGVFSLVFTLGCANTSGVESGKAKLQYKGSFIKGDAFFSAGKKSDSLLAEALNSYPDLMKILSELDLLSMNVSADNGTLKVELSPLGGAYTYTIFPPMKYGGLLPDTDLERIRQVLNIFAAGFSDNARRVAGAE